MILLLMKGLCYSSQREMTEMIVTLIIQLIVMVMVMVMILFQEMEMRKTL